MIFVTVGTHEQQFDRLVSQIDQLRGRNEICEEVVIQTGYCTYIPMHCVHSRFFPYSEMVEYVRKARIVITHGGPSSFMMALQMGKTPIVVPRQQRFKEHVNDHQLHFARLVEEEQKTILVVEDIAQLGSILCQYDDLIHDRCGNLAGNNTGFCDNIRGIAQELCAER